MSAITPQTNLKLLKVPIEIDNKNQINFANATVQYNYFNSLNKLEVDDFTYQRKDSVIRYPANIDDIINYNYVMYQNEGFSNKWFYAFITNMEYVNNNMTAITIKTDTFQTWGFDLQFKQSFIEREHVTDDSIGKHTVPEQLETGEYICDSAGSLYSTANNCYIAVACTDFPSEIPINTNYIRYNGVYGGGTPIVLFQDNTAGTISASNYFRLMANLGKADSIVCVYLIPQSLAGEVTFTHYTCAKSGGGSIEFDLGKVANSEDSVVLSTSSSITPPTTIDGYTPKNNKLKTYPYCYLYASNNVGSDSIFRYEDFVNNAISFKTVGSITPGCSIRCVPLNYKKLADTTGLKSYSYGITGAKYPICSWVTDVYTNWLTQNSVNIGVNMATTALQAGVSLHAGDFAGFGTGVAQIAGSIGEIYAHSLTPPQANGNTNSGDVTFSTNKMDIPYYKMNIRNEYAKIIDNYFSMYGYKINLLKDVQFNTRTNWNYVKTIDVNIEAFIPQEDLQDIKNMFNNGITIWHNPSTFLDYSQNNNIIQ